MHYSHMKKVKSNKYYPVFIVRHAEGEATGFDGDVDGREKKRETLQNR